MSIQDTMTQKLGKGISEASNEEIYFALLEIVQEMARQKETNGGKKKL